MCNKQTKRNLKMWMVMVVVFLVGGGSAKADFAFGTATNLGPTVNSSVGDGTPNISADGLELYFCSPRPGGEGGDDIYVTTRATDSNSWGAPVNLGSTVNTASVDAWPSISADGLELFFTSNRLGTFGLNDLWVTTRPTVSDPWETPVNLGSTVNTSYRDSGPSISADGLELFFMSQRPGGYGSYDIYVTTRATVSDPWTAPVNLGPTVNSPGNQQCPNISADGLTLFLSWYNIWVTTRATVSDPNWGTPVDVGPPVNTFSGDICPSISADGSTLYFMSDRPGGYGGADLWQAPVAVGPACCDLNNDGIVDLQDLTIFAEGWLWEAPWH